MAPAALLLIFPGIWLFSVYPYYMSQPYRFYNQSGVRNRTAQFDDRSVLLGEGETVQLKTRQQEQGANETLPVICLCQEYSVCGCDEYVEPPSPSFLYFLFLKGEPLLTLLETVTQTKPTSTTSSATDPTPGSTNPSSQFPMSITCVPSSLTGLCPMAPPRLVVRMVLRERYVLGAMAGMPLWRRLWGVLLLYCRHVLGGVEGRGRREVKVG